MTFHPKGLMALAAFAVILLLALNSSIVPVVIAAGIVLEVLLWRGVFGFGRQLAATSHSEDSRSTR
jgi:predicted cation transporter